MIKNIAAHRFFTRPCETRIAAWQGRAENCRLVPARAHPSAAIIPPERKLIQSEGNNLIYERRASQSYS